MKISLSLQQASSFKNNGSLELEGLFDSVAAKKYHVAILEALEHRKSKNGIVQGRDLWRDSDTLKSLTRSRKITSLAKELTGKATIRLACDQWFAPNYSHAKPISIKDMLSIQGILCGMIIQFQPGNFEIPENISPLGLLPFPKEQGNVILVKPDLLINWQSISSNLGLYLIVYTDAVSIYRENTQDPAGLALKNLNYGYGDRLNDEHHPSF